MIMFSSSEENYLSILPHQNATGRFVFRPASPEEAWDCLGYRPERVNLHLPLWGHSDPTIFCFRCIF
jgi:hypothetical protein